MELEMILHRFTVNGVGIYDFLKKSVSPDVWKKEILPNPAVSWLPKPALPFYGNRMSWFTESGCAAFKKHTLPFFKRFLDGVRILEVVTDEVSLGPVIYEDDWQVVVSD
jgi:hypothetical protein